MGKIVFGSFCDLGTLIFFVILLLLIGSLIFSSLVVEHAVSHKVAVTIMNGKVSLLNIFFMLFISQVYANYPLLYYLS